jgi:PadR family transcriptional regulator PadR
MKLRDTLSTFEQQILRAVSRLGEDAYSLTIWREMVALTNRTVSMGRVHVVLWEMERKGLVTLREEPKGVQRGGRYKLCVALTERGRKAILL